MNPLFDTAMALAHVAIDMKREGFPVDEQRRAEHGERLKKARAAAEERFLQVVGGKLELDGLPRDEINLDSSPQIRKLFYDVLGLPPKKAYFSKTTGIPGVNKSALRDAKIEHIGPLRDAATALLDYREQNKYENTYVGSGYYLEPEHYGLKVFRQDKRVRFSWSPCAAETFRSTGDGQQVPKHVYDASGNITRPGLRDMFISPEGMTLIEADFSQQELRKVALYAEAKGLINELTRPGGDAHRMFSQAMFKIPGDKWDPKIHKGMRDLGKTLVFAVLIYGGKPETGWRQVAPKYPKLTVAFIEEAKAEAYKAIPEIPRYHTEQIRFAKQRGYTVLPNDDYKISWKFGPIGGEAIGEPENSEIINKRIQTSCAIMMNKAMLRVRKALPESCKIILQVHDALFVLVPDDYIDTAARTMKAQMEQEESYLMDKMFYPVDISTGKCWGALEKWKG